MRQFLWHSIEPATISIAGVVTVLALSLASCASHESRILTDACIKAGGETSVTDASLNSRCECAASAAQKYLDPDDYKLLVGVAGIYNEDAPADVKLQRLIAGLINQGVTPAKASVAALDMMYLGHKITNECQASGHQDV